MTATGPTLDGRYRLIAPLAAGGMSVVWRGHDNVLAREVAVKVLASIGSDAAYADRVRHEAMAIARISHPYIANVYDYGESTATDGTSVPYIVMELVEGESLAQVLARGRLSWPTAAGICAQVASALAAAHQHGVVHRDVTPANVMLCVDGVKVVDFGIAAHTGQSADEQIFGTPAYLAPERLGGGPARSATDVYGIGLLLYQSITGHLPWSASTTTQMLSAHQYVPPAPLPAIDGMPPQVAALCVRALAVDPDHRPTSAQVCAELSTLARDGDPRARPALQSVPTGPVSIERRPHATRVLPHGATIFVDPDAATAAMRPVDLPNRGLPAWGGPGRSFLGRDLRRRNSGPDTAGGRIGDTASRAVRAVRERGIFVLPAALMLMLIVCLGVAGLHPSAAPNPTRTPTAPAVTHVPAKIKAPPAVVAACAVDYAYTSQWIFGFTAQMTVVNTGTAALAGWALTFDLPAGERLAGGWNGQWAQSGTRVTVHDVVYNTEVPAGGSVSLGFIGTEDGRTDAPPRHFRLNGVSCGHR